ncbi:hypothetical protein MSG28_016027 [Choristoneura fumiferana]|uniref:Uncharacterized protein n=1 Tax=Choristoneura fumiferana TaxID=7141 RepID=A0ACC0K5U4_CHOFU|nr:hypothetical protein MSG28_016027 [Choristoneura fumiferana]
MVVAIRVDLAQALAGLKFTTSYAVKENIVRKPAQTCEAFNGACEVPNPHWARVGTMAKPLVLRGGLCPAEGQGRVYCEDSHAKWDFRGYSCPVNCNNVVYAVERLKLKDVNNLLTPESQTIEDLNNDKVKNVIHSNEGTAPSVRAENTTNLYIICEKVLENNVAVNEVQEELAKFNKSNCSMEVEELHEHTFHKNKGTFSRHHHQPIAAHCWTQASLNERPCALLFVKKKLKSYYMKLRRCRRSYEDEFVSIFTKILNRHAHGKYKFTEELTAVFILKFFVFM